jgi:hypothetical protein
MLICLVVVLLFAGTLVSGHFGTAIALLFIVCMIALGSGFAIFLIETQVGSRAVRVRNALLEHQAEEQSWLDSPAARSYRAVLQQGVSTAK